MTDQTQQDFLKEKIDFLIGDYKKRRNSVRRHAHVSKVAVVILGALTTVVVGLREFAVLANWGEILGIIALLLSASATTVAAWEGFANYSWRWVHSRHVLVKLLQLKDQIEFHAADQDGLSPTETQDYFNRMITVIDEANAQWSDKRGAALDQ